MCGITGILDIQNREWRETIDAMRSRLEHRGPDDSGQDWADNIHLAHQRLSVLDLSTAGHQPMKHGETGVTVVHNGEIYNFRELRNELESKGHCFTSGTDTEVILRGYLEWGERCVERFNGMFAVGVWDPREGNLLLLRDRLGIKPLYYFRNNDVLAFSSRLGSLLEHPECPKAVSTDSLELYFCLGYVPAPYSILERVNKLQPGCLLSVSVGQLENGSPTKPECYWKISDFTPDPTLERAKETDLVHELESLISDAVRRRLIADVPVGVFLSGGLDSSLIAALATKYSPGISAFTIGFEEARYSELPLAKQAAQKLNLTHHVHTVTPDDLLDVLPTYSRHYDEPFADASAIPTLAVSELTRQEVTVSLTGDGGDELLAGYPIYRYLRNWLSPAYYVPGGLRSILGSMINKGGRRAALFGTALQQEDLAKAFGFLRSINREIPPPTIGSDSQRYNEFIREEWNTAAKDLLSAMTQFDAHHYMSGGILQKVDVASMAYGLEARVPLLDHHVVEFAMRLPAHYKLRGRIGKHLLRRLVARHLPKSLVEAPKHGFNIPLSEWLRCQLSEQVEQDLSKNSLEKIEGIDPTKVIPLWQTHRDGRTDCGPMLWAVLCYVRWYNDVLMPARAKTGARD